MRKKLIYVILSDTGTWFTRLIRWYTKVPCNHASIALDPGLTKVYSFGRKRPGNPFIGGFVREDLHRGELFDRATCAIYRCEVSEDQYRDVCKLLLRFEKDAHLYTYNLVGFIGVLLNRPIRRRHAFFCSQFVAHVFEQIGNPLTHKCAALTTPKDLQYSPAITLVYEGHVPTVRMSGKVSFRGDILRKDKCAAYPF